MVLVDGATTADGRYPVVQHLRGRSSASQVPHFGLARADGERLRLHKDTGYVREVFGERPKLQHQQLLQRCWQ